MTLNNIEQLFKDLGRRHLQLNSYYNQKDFDVTAIDDVIYPSLVINTSEIRLPRTENGYSVKNYAIELQVIDLVHKDEGNKQEVLSDCDSILNDIVSEFSTHPEYNKLGLDLINDVTLSPLRGAYGDEISGWNTLLTLEIPSRINWCGSPLLALPGFTSDVEFVSVIDGQNPNSPISMYTGTYTCVPFSGVTVSNSNDSYTETTANDVEISDSTISNATDSYIQLVPATENLELPNINFTDSDGTVSSVPSMEDITATPVVVKDDMFKITINTAGSFTLPFQNAATNVTVYWGDGSSDVITSYNQSELTHTYSSAGVYQISVDGQFGGVKFNNGVSRLELTSIDNWGSAALSSNSTSFRGCSNVNGSYTDYPNILVVTDSQYMFEGCSNFNSTLVLNTSKVTATNNMFTNCVNLNSLLTFDTSNVTTMRIMFQGCSSFNQPLSFDTSNVTTLQNFLSGATLFNQDVSGFNISSLTNASNMLNGTSFDTTNYDLLLISWAAQTHNNNVPFHAGSAKYSPGAAANARAVLIADGWTITDGGQV